MTLIPFSIGWLALAGAVLALALYRKVVARNENDMLHIQNGAARLVEQQTQLAQRLEFVDRWGKALTILVVVFGVILGAVYAYQVWMDGLHVAY